jgi:effector-binding domain-containing protein
MSELTETRPALTPEIVNLPEQQAAVVEIHGRVDEFPRLLGEAFGLTAGALGASGAVIAGHPFVRYVEFGERVQADVGFPFTGTLVPTDRVRQTQLPAGRAVTTTYVGPYQEIAVAWNRVASWMRERELTASGPAWESYLTGPGEPGPPVTEIFFPIR